MQKTMKLFIIITLTILILGIVIYLFQKNKTSEKSDSIKARDQNKKVYIIDGKKFNTLQGFYDEISLKVIPGNEWGQNLDAFNDILRGGFGTPDEGFIIKWVNSDISRKQLGVDLTILHKLELMKKCHPSNISFIENQIKDLKNGKGKTLFEELVSIIQMHGPKGDEQESNVDLILE